jgi:hypothetical protein
MRIEVQTCPDKSTRPYSKNKQSKKDWGMAQVVECLSGKWGLLSLTPQYHQKEIYLHRELCISFSFLYQNTGSMFLRNFPSSYHKCLGFRSLPNINIKRYFPDTPRTYTGNHEYRILWSSI